MQSPRLLYFCFPFDRIVQVIVIELFIFSVAEKNAARTVLFQITQMSGLEQWSPLPEKHWDTGENADSQAPPQTY
jgi:hypothetical protein